MIKHCLKDIIRLLNYKEKICNEGSCSEMYLEKSFKKSNLSPKKRLPIASSLSSTSLAFYLNPLISNVEMDKKIKKIIKVLNLISI